MRGKRVETQRKDRWKRERLISRDSSVTVEIWMLRAAETKRGGNGYLLKVVIHQRFFYDDPLCESLCGVGRQRKKRITWLLMNRPRDDENINLHYPSSWFFLAAPWEIMKGGAKCFISPPLTFARLKRSSWRQQYKFEVGGGGGRHWWEITLRPWQGYCSPSIHRAAREHTVWLVARRHIDSPLMEHKLTIAMQWFGARTHACKTKL